MPRTTLLRRAAAPAVAAVSLALAGLAMPAADAARAIPALHESLPVLMGSATAVTADVFTQAPATTGITPPIAAGSVIYSIGSVVYAVKPGATAYKVALHAPGHVIALAANATRIFAQVGLKVYEYSRANGNPLGTWTLTSPVTPITSAGLIANGNTLWSWTDAATIQSGFKLGTVSRINTSALASTPVIVTEHAYPGDMTATSKGLYYDFVGSSDYIGFAPATGAAPISVTTPYLDTPMAAWGGAVEVLYFGTTQVSVISFNQTTLGLVSVRKVSPQDRTIAAISSGLLSLRQPCAAIYCLGATVSRVSLATGAETGTVAVPGAYLLLPGASAAVIEIKAGKLYLVRITP